MLDKNGREIHTGDVVIVSGGYFKRDNGRQVVVRSPGDDSWYGDDHCLYSIGKTGKVCKRNRTHFWPILVTANSYWTRVEAEAHNEEHATIEVVGHMEVPAGGWD